MSLLLTPVEARVIASLVEKSITTPQYYPMSANAVMAAANQKTVRHPVMNLSEAEVTGALHRLEEEKLCARDGYGGRVTKWRHRFQHQMLLKEPAMAVLATLMLRGPQTLAELRANAAALNGPADAEALQAVLEDLADRAQPLVRQIPRAAGQAADRWAHLLSGEPESVEAPPARPRESGQLDVLLARIEALEARVTALEGDNARHGAPDGRGPY